MDIPKYDGNVHPDEWINDIQQYFEIKRMIGYSEYRYVNISKALIDSTISLPKTGINSYEQLRNALKEDISFTVFKNTNKRMLQFLKYIPEKEGGKTSNFISNFRKLCYNAEINDIEEQKKYLYSSLPMNYYFNYISNEFYKKMKNVNSMNELIKEFEDIVLEESILIKSGSIVALKHVATGKYLSSIENLCYKTGSGTQVVFLGSSEPHPNSLWKILFKPDKELATYTGTSISLQHVKSNSKLLGILYYCYDSHFNYGYGKSPITEHTEVSCNTSTNNSYSWKFNHSKLENHQGYLKSNDTINLSTKKKYTNNQVEFLCSHDIQFTIDNDNFQEVVCHNERLGGNYEWCIELMKQN